MQASVILRPDREKPIIQHHPWVFSGGISDITGDPQAGDVVDVLAADGRWLARGFYSPLSQIRVRIASRQPDQPLDEAWLRGALQRAVAGRAALISAENSACRLVYSESDGIPGLIVDRYGRWLVVQLSTQGLARRAELVFDLLEELLQPLGIYERSDAEARRREGLPPADGLRRGSLPPADLLVQPIGNGLPFAVDLVNGQKTGVYLDQVLNHQRVAAYCRGAEVLDCFSYSGGFAVAAAAAGAAALTLIDASDTALDTAAARLAALPNVPPHDLIEDDVFQVLRRFRARGLRFDVIVLDPPKFAQSHAHIDRATRGYKDINLIAMQLLRPGGILATFSCSGLVSPDLFQKVLFGAAVDAGRDVQIIEKLSHAPDHPILLSFPESEYLKGAICRVW
jgi:23S rRNA (cytosine1962-C5)-methyltransferase